MDIKGAITDLSVIVLTANDSDTIVYYLMGKFLPGEEDWLLNYLDWDSHILVKNQL